MPRYLSINGCAFPVKKAECPVRCAKVMMEHNLWEQPTNDCSNLRPTPLEETHADTAQIARNQRLDSTEIQEITKHNQKKIK